MPVYYEIRTMESGHLESHLAETVTDLCELLDELKGAGSDIVGCYKVMEDGGSPRSVKVRVRKAGKIVVITEIPNPEVPKINAGPQTPELKPLPEDDEAEQLLEEMPSRGALTADRETVARADDSTASPGPSRVEEGTDSGIPARQQDAGSDAPARTGGGTAPNRPART